MQASIQCSAESSYDLQWFSENGLVSNSTELYSWSGTTTGAKRCNEQISMNFSALAWGLIISDKEEKIMFLPFSLLSLISTRCDSNAKPKPQPLPFFSLIGPTKVFEKIENWLCPSWNVYVNCSCRLTCWCVSRILQDYDWLMFYLATYFNVSVDFLVFEAYALRLVFLHLFMFIRSF